VNAEYKALSDTIHYESALPAPFQGDKPGKAKKKRGILL